ncbi:MAG: PEP/pyruvate-binding domain-containing protein [Candidatus Woesearchaeota archaeon]
MIAGIDVLLPKGNFFGSDNNDEFSISLDGQEKGVFKTFEYLSLPFSITGNTELYSSLLTRCKERGTSFNQELESSPEAKMVVQEVFSKMGSSPCFSRQALDTLLAQVYVRDEILTSDIPLELTFEQGIARFIFGWTQQADFYCIEGLVGGEGKDNPLVVNGRERSLNAGALDCLEEHLPSMMRFLSTDEQKKLVLQISSLIERDYLEVMCAVKTLETVHGYSSIQEQEAHDLCASVERLSQQSLMTNIEHGKFVNSIIRFHNWLSLHLLSRDSALDTYDSVCLPAKNALSLTPGTIKEVVQTIREATSPKGVALARLVDEGVLSGKEGVSKELDFLESEDHLNELEKHQSDYFLFRFESPAFYTPLCGGKWKGLKLLHDAQQSLELKYRVANGSCVSSLAINRVLDRQGILELIKGQEFNLDETIRRKIVASIESISFEEHLPQVFEQLRSNCGQELVVRSSMYGEDGVSNFSGTYESVCSTPENLDQALRTVVSSYFSNEAVKSRQDLGLAHLPGISVVVQNKLEGKGGVINLTKEGIAISYASNGEKAVAGEGDHHQANDFSGLEQALHPEMQPYFPDLAKLHEVFGDIDVEFILNGSQLYLTQMRPKHLPDLKHKIDTSSYERVTLNSVEELTDLTLTKKKVAVFSFLSQEGIMGKRDEIMEGVRRNREYLVAVEGPMPPVAHIPNKIEGHFGVPYFYEVKR